MSSISASIHVDMTAITKKGDQIIEIYDISKNCIDEAIDGLNKVTASDNASKLDTMTTRHEDNKIIIDEAIDGLNEVAASDNASKLATMTTRYEGNKIIINRHIRSLDLAITRLQTYMESLLNRTRTNLIDISTINQKYNDLFVKKRNELEKVIADLEKAIADKKRNELEKAIADKKGEEGIKSDAAKYVKYKSKYLELR